MNVEIMERVKESLKGIDGAIADLVRTFVGHSLILIQAVDRTGSGESYRARRILDNMLYQSVARILAENK